MRKDRLLKLADFLETKVKPSWFDLSYWAEEGWKNKDCGTTACAMGWATVCFPKSGLSLELIGAENRLVYRHKGQGRPFYNWDAVAKFMELQEGDCVYLFSRSQYSVFDRINPKVIAKRIREFVALRGEGVTGK